MDKYLCHHRVRESVAGASNFVPLLMLLLLSEVM